MKRKMSQDERVLEQQHKVSSEVEGILMIALFISILLQQFFLDAPFKQYAVELICLIGALIYKIVRYITLGLDINSEGKRARIMPYIISIMGGIIVTIINGILNYIRYAEHYKKDGISYFIPTLVVTFISATIFCYFVISFFYLLNKKKQDKIRKQLDEEEENE